MSLPKPYYQDDWATIYHGDCRDILPLIEQVDLVLTDPPYGIDYQSNMRVVSDKFNKIKNDSNDSRFLVYPILYEKLNFNSCSIIFCSFKNYSFDYIELSKLFEIKNCVIWHKGGGWNRRFIS